MRPTIVNVILTALQRKDIPWPSSADVHRELDFPGAGIPEQFRTKSFLFSAFALKADRIIDNYAQTLHGMSKSEMRIFHDEYPLRWFVAAQDTPNLEANYVFQTKTIKATRYLFFDLLLWINMESMTTIEARMDRTDLEGVRGVRNSYAMHTKPLAAAKWMAFSDEEIGGNRAH